MSGIFVTASKGGSLFQVPVRIIVLSAESRASNRVMTSGARTVPLSPGVANKWLPCNPTQMLRRQLGPSRREGGPGIPVNTSTVRFRRTAKRTVRTHSGPSWYPSAPVSCFFCVGEQRE